MHAAEQEQTAELPSAVGAMALIVMMSGNASQSLLFALLPSLLPAMARSFGGNGALIAQMMFAMASLGLMLMSLVSGAIVQRTGVRASLVLAALLYGLSGAIPVLTASVPIVLASRLLVGAGCGLFTTASMILLTQSRFGAARSRAIGYQSAIGSVAGVVALFAGGATVTRFGWHPAFLLYALFALPLVLLSIAGVRPVATPARTARQGLGQVLLQLWPVYVAACFLMMVALLTGSDVPFVLTAIGVTKPLLQSIIVSMSTIFVVIGSTLFGRIQTRLGPQRTFAASLLSAAIGMGIVGTGASGAVVAAGCALLGLGIGVYIPYLWVLATGLVPEPLRGHAIGLLTTSMYLGGFLYPFLITTLQKEFGLAGALVAVAVALGLGAVAVMLGPRTRLAGSPI